VKFNNLLEMELTVEDLREKSVKYCFKIYNKKTNELIAERYLVAVAVNRHTLKAIQIPHEAVEELKAFCSGEEAK